MFDKLFANEDDMFSGGSPKAKYFDIVYNANRNLVEQQLEILIEKLVVLQEMTGIEYEDLEKELINRRFNDKDFETKKDSEFMNLTADVIMRSDS
jgi:hypothetical protein